MATRVTPYAGTSIARLTALFNTQSGTSFVHGTHFTFGAPTVSNDGNGRNTLIDVLPVGQQYSPSSHRYTRLSLGVLANLTGTAALEQVNVGSSNFNIHAILSEINLKLGLNLTTQEVENTVYTPGLSTYRLTIANSLVWLPGSYFDFTTTNPP